jgi:hypothetical protein
MPVDYPEGMRRKGSGKVRARKPFAARVTRMLPGQNFEGTNFSNIGDEAMEQVGEFMQWVSISEPVGLVSSENVSRGVPSAQEEDEEDIRELTDMGAMARDLVRRIQRLRGQMRPGSAARSALPDLRMDGEEDEVVGIRTYGNNDIDAPVVDGMD